MITLFDPSLAMAADVLDSLETVRIANSNRLMILTRSEADSDGEERGFGLDESHPDVARLAAMVETMKKLEHDAELGLTKQMKKHPLGPWVKAQKGVGEKQAARLLASIGDPYWHVVENRPRTVSELWAYSGLSVLRNEEFTGPFGAGASLPGEGVAQRRKKGVKSNWSANAKSRAYLVAMSCLKQLVKPCERIDEDSVKHVDDCTCSPYRVVYDDRRAHTANTHPDWTPGHSHNDAIRVSSKEILKNLWIEAKRLHELASN